jgi:hypothetical protein
MKYIHGREDVTSPTQQTEADCACATYTLSYLNYIRGKTTYFNTHASTETDASGLLGIYKGKDDLRIGVDGNTFNNWFFSYISAIGRLKGTVRRKLM